VKSAQNKTKHGIDFEEAQFLWADPLLVEIPARTKAPRWMWFGKIGEKHWSAVIMLRDENIHLISLRRSRPEEITIYENEDLESQDI